MVHFTDSSVIDCTVQDDNYLSVTAISKRIIFWRKGLFLWISVSMRELDGRMMKMTP